MIPLQADKVLGKALDSVSPHLRDRLLTGLWPFVYQFGEGNSVKTEGQMFLRRWVGLLRDGKQAPFAKHAEGIFRGFTLGFRGTENLPEEPAIFLSNHPKGPIMGNWYPFVLNMAVARAFDNFDAAPRWFHKEFSESYLFGETSLASLYDRVSGMIVKSTNGFMISRDRKSLGKSIAAAQDHLKSGGRVALSFEGQANWGLERARSGVGLLLYSTSMGGEVPIVPTACWRRKDILNVAFGKPVSIRDQFGNIGLMPTKEKSQEIVDYLARQTAQMLPQRRRGVYS